MAKLRQANHNGFVLSIRIHSEEDVHPTSEQENQSILGNIHEPMDTTGFFSRSGQLLEAVSSKVQCHAELRRSDTAVTPSK